MPLHHSIADTVAMVHLLLFLPKLPLILNAFPVPISIREQLGSANLALCLPFEIFLNIGILGLFDIIAHRLPISIDPFMGDRAGRRLGATLANDVAKSAVFFVLHIPSVNFSSHTDLPGSSFLVDRDPRTL